MYGVSCSQRKETFLYRLTLAPSGTSVESDQSPIARSPRSVSFPEVIPELFTVYQWVADHAEEYLTEQSVAHILNTYENQENELLHVFNISHTDWVERVAANQDEIDFMNGLVQ